MPQPGRRHHQRSRADEFCREAADHHRPQRDAVHDIGTLIAHDLERLKKIAQAVQWTETAAPAFDPDHGKSFGLEPLALSPPALRPPTLPAAIPPPLPHP